MTGEEEDEPGAKLLPKPKMSRKGFFAPLQEYGDPVASPLNADDKWNVHSLGLRSLGDDYLTAQGTSSMRDDVSPSLSGDATQNQREQPGKSDWRPQNSSHSSGLSSKQKNVHYFDPFYDDHQLREDEASFLWNQKQGMVQQRINQWSEYYKSASNEYPEPGSSSNPIQIVERRKQRFIMLGEKIEASDCLNLMNDGQDQPTVIDAESEMKTNRPALSHAYDDLTKNLDNLTLSANETASTAPISSQEWSDGTVGSDLSSKLSHNSEQETTRSYNGIMDAGSHAPSTSSDKSISKKDLHLALYAPSEYGAYVADTDWVRGLEISESSSFPEREQPIDYFKIHNNDSNISDEGDNGIFLRMQKSEDAEVESDQTGELEGHLRFSKTLGVQDHSHEHNSTVEHSSIKHNPSQITANSYNSEISFTEGQKVFSMLSSVESDQEREEITLKLPEVPSLQQPAIERNSAPKTFSSLEVSQSSESSKSGGRSNATGASRIREMESLLDTELDLDDCESSSFDYLEYNLSDAATKIVSNEANQMSKPSDSQGEPIKKRPNSLRIQLSEEEESDDVNGQFEHHIIGQASTSSRAQNGVGTQPEHDEIIQKQLETIPLGASMEEIQYLNKFLSIVGPDFDSNSLSLLERESLQEKAQSNGIPSQALNRILDQSAGFRNWETTSIQYPCDASAFEEGVSTFTKSTDGSRGSRTTRYTNYSGYNSEYASLSNISPSSDTGEGIDCGCIGGNRFWEEFSKEVEDTVRDNFGSVLSADSMSVHSQEYQTSWDAGSNTREMF